MASCSICFEVLKDSDICKTHCNHTFHTSCLLKWINSNSNCPLCRTELVEKIEPKKEVYRDPLDTILDRPLHTFSHNSFLNYMG